MSGPMSAISLFTLGCVFIGGFIHVCSYKCSAGLLHILDLRLLDRERIPLFSRLRCRLHMGRGSESCLLPPQANPASTGSYSMKTGTNTTAHTNPINEQGGCTTSLGHHAFDQLVVVDQVLPINDRMTRSEE